MKLGSKKYVAFIAALTAAILGTTSVAADNSITSKTNSDDCTEEYNLVDYCRENLKSFGGAFYDNDGFLVIQSVSMEELSRIPISYLKDNDKIKYSEVQYTFSELLEAQDKIDELMLRSDIYYSYTDESKNCLVIGSTRELSDKEKVSLEELTGLNNLTYEVSEDNFEDDVTAANGDRIKDTSTNGGYSLGASVKWTENGSTVRGWITAGHSTAVGHTFTYNGNTMGQVKYQNYGGALDSCLIEKASGSTVSGSNSLHGSTDTFSLYGSPTQSESISMYGSTSGTTSGTVTSTSFSRTINGVLFTDLISASYTSQPGDSGAPLIQNTNGSNKLVGINKGHYTFDGVYTCLGVKIYNICNAYGVTVSSN